MDAKELKLQLVQQVLQTEDTEVLRTALRVLQLGNRPESSSPSQGPPVLQQGQLPRNEEAKQLQRDIDELFNP